MPEAGDAFRFMEACRCANGEVGAGESIMVATGVRLVSSWDPGRTWRNLS